MAETGFTFEYSATFGQALTAARNEELTREYAKAIAFDYSYRYFHGDGFGKDFNILNLRDDGGLGVRFVGVPERPREDPAERTDRLLLGNLLAFYEQQRAFAEQEDALRPYNLERPLWVFVGGTVNAVYSRNKQRQSDVLTVVRFLDRVLRNPGGWAVAGIERLLAGESGLQRPDDRDVFEGRFGSLRDAKLSPQALYQQILESVLHAPINDSLRLGFVRGSSGEIGLKANSSSQLLRRHHHRRRQQLPQAGIGARAGDSDAGRSRAHRLVRHHQRAPHHHRGAGGRPQVHGGLELVARLQHGADERRPAGRIADHPAVRTRCAAARLRSTASSAAARCRATIRRTSACWKR